MEQIVGVIDMDGFVINKTFYCKELGALKAGKDEGDSYLFDIGTRWHDLTRKQQKIVCFSQETCISYHFAFLGEQIPFHLAT